MHISEGVLGPPVLVAGALLATGGIALGLKSMSESKMVVCGVMAAVFFLGSLIHVPLGFSNAHLLLCGLVGILLGWSSFPAIFSALCLQALLFQYGGITTLGINTFTMGSAAVCAWYVFQLFSNVDHAKNILWGGFCAGFLGVACSALLTAVALAFTNEGFIAAAVALLTAHVPVMIAEGVITALTAGFIARAKPQLLAINQN